MVTARSFVATVAVDGPAVYIAVPFDPRAVFGKVRAPVVVTVNGYAYRSTIAVMGGRTFLPLRKSHREAAGVAAGDEVAVTLALDEAARKVDPPADLVEALDASADGWAGWHKLSFSHQREIAEAIETAKKPETRTRRVAQAVARLTTARAEG